jgi:drug/metabolite transporter (DMT)-like permease
VILAVACGLQQMAMETVTAGEASFITGFYMVMVPIVGIFRGQKATWKIAVGVVFGMSGLYLIAVKGDLSLGFGQILMFTTTFLWTAHILVIDHFAPKVSSLRFSLVQFLTTAVLSTALAFVFDAHPFAGFEYAFTDLLYTGFISVGIAYTLQVMGQRYALPAHASLILATEALWGAVGGALLLGENMGIRGYAGAALMVAGIVISQLGSAGKSPPA